MESIELDTGTSVGEGTGYTHQVSQISQGVQVACPWRLRRVAPHVQMRTHEKNKSEAKPEAARNSELIDTPFQHQPFIE